jgi:hypothetical protein
MFVYVMKGGASNPTVNCEIFKNRDIEKYGGGY